jgi:hypothetical protein
MSARTAEHGFGPSGARHLNQHRTLLERRTQGSASELWDSLRDKCTSITAGDNSSGVGFHAFSHLDRGEVLHLNQSMHLETSSVRSKNEIAMLKFRPHNCGVAGVNVWGKWFTQNWVTVIPHEDGPQVLAWSVNR